MCFFSANTFADAQKQLSERFAKLNSFSAQFEQTVTSPDDEIISKGRGEFAVTRPNLFYWKSETPDENILVSDGKTLWYYSPFIEQVTAMWLENATSQTPFILLTRNKNEDWDRYHVNQKGDVFTLTPKQKTDQGQFIVGLLPNGKLTEFSVIEQDGQKNRFVFSHVKQSKPSADLFKFTVPKGVELDDQRE